MSDFDVEDPHPETASVHCGQTMQAMQPWTDGLHTFRCKTRGCKHREKVRFGPPPGPGDVVFAAVPAGAGARVVR